MANGVATAAALRRLASSSLTIAGETSRTVASSAILC